MLRELSYDSDIPWELQYKGPTEKSEIGSTWIQFKRHVENNWKIIKRGDRAIISHQPHLQDNIDCYLMNARVFGGPDTDLKVVYKTKTSADPQKIRDLSLLLSCSSATGPDIPDMAGYTVCTGSDYNQVARLQRRGANVVTVKEALAVDTEYRITVERVGGRIRRLLEDTATGEETEPLEFIDSDPICDRHFHVGFTTFSAEARFYDIEIHTRKSRHSIESFRVPFDIEAGIRNDDSSDRVFKLKLRSIADGYYLMFEDITSRRRAEKNRLLLETAVGRIDEYIAITEPDGTVLFVNPAFEKITGRPCGEALGRRLDLFSSTEQSSKFHRELMESVSSGRTWKGRRTSSREDGSQYVESVSVSAVRGEAGEILNYVVVARDITEELEIQQRLQHVQKMETIGVMAGGVAHEYNNILTAILGYASLISADRTLPDKTLRRASEIERAGQRAAEITRRLLAFGRKQTPEMRVIDVNDTIKQSVRYISRVLRPDVTVETRLQEGLPAILADSAQFQQALMNLCLNSQAAITGADGLISVETSSVRIDREFVDRYPYAKLGDHVRITVADNGHGMDDETMSRVFDPFFTTRQMGQGTGLGLSIVFGIIKNHNGFINVESSPGRGAKFSIYLPVTTSETATPAETEPRIRGGVETILVVDDDEMVLQLARSVLDDFGYTTLGAASASDAIEIYRGRGDSIDLVLSDIMMPGMSGTELAGELRRINPAVRVILSSGYSVEDLPAVTPEVAAYVSKPYRAIPLAKTVREVLDSKNRTG